MGGPEVGVLLVWFVFWAVVGGLVGYAIGNGKGRGTEGFWLGFLLGFIGWIIVALMAPSAEYEQQRAAIAGLVSAAASGVVGRVRGRRADARGARSRSGARLASVDSAVATSNRTSGGAPEEDLDQVRREFPAEFATAVAHLQALPEEPRRPARWLRELCRRMNAGSPAEAAAQRIPLDWDDVPPPPPRPAARGMLLGDPTTAGDFEAVARAYPIAYDRGRAVLAGLSERPSNPDVWLFELCRRIDAGSPPEAAAARIPLDFG